VKAQYGPKASAFPLGVAQPISYPDDIYHDLIPLDDTHARVFVLDHGRLSVWDGVGTQFPDMRGLWTTQWKEREEDRCPAGFCEPFVVPGSAEGGYTFVTESGQAFFSPPGKGKR
jgi:hypothetical protein